jgi:serine/threonine-protein kinase HipA
MDKTIKAIHGEKVIGSLFESSQREYVFEYVENPDTHLSLSMPATQRVYLSKFALHPFFDSFIPEGYLFEVLKNLILKREGKADDFTMFYYLASGIEGRVKFLGKEPPVREQFISLEEILKNDTWDTFKRILMTFLHKNAISGVQPKTVASVKDKASLGIKEYIIKTFGDEYPNLAENEYFCMMAVRRAGIEIPRVYLSENRRFLVVEKFTYDEERGEYLGFEEIGSLLGKRRDTKYEGSYEQIARVIRSFSTRQEKDLKAYFKLTVMNFLLRNGDAHMKNFGLLYSDDFSEIRLSPAYDVVCTTVYIPDDKPALFMHGTKRWHGKDRLIEFGMKSCGLSKEEARQLYEECTSAVRETAQEVEEYLNENRSFRGIGERMVKEWEHSIGTGRLSVNVSANKPRGLSHGL